MFKIYKQNHILLNLNKIMLKKFNETNTMWNQKQLDQMYAMKQWLRAPFDWKSMQSYKQSKDAFDPLIFTQKKEKKGD